MNDSATIRFDLLDAETILHSDSFLMIIQDIEDHDEEEVDANEIFVDTETNEITVEGPDAEWYIERLIAAIDSEFGVQEYARCYY